VSGVVAFDNWDKGFMEKKMSPECKWLVTQNGKKGRWEGIWEPSVHIQAVLHLTQNHGLIHGNIVIRVDLITPCSFPYLWTKLILTD
jgi:hypothetical protein